MDPLIGAALIGGGSSLLGGLFGSKKKDPPQTTTQTNEPWSGIVPYLTGGGSTTRKLKPGVSPVYGGNPLSFDQWAAGQPGTIAPGWADGERLYNPPSMDAYNQYVSGKSWQTMSNTDSDYITETTPGGIYPEAQRLYGETQWTPEMQRIMDASLGDYAGRYNQWEAGRNMANDVIGGGYSPNITTVAAPEGSYGVDLNQTLSGMGELDPTAALSRLLSGTPDNPYLDSQAGAIINTLTRNTMENVMPGLRSTALASGGYGGSRQGIAEGLAASRLNQDIAPALTNLYGTAYENAQGRMQNTGQFLTSTGLQNEQANANRAMTADQFRAELALRNNEQEMQRASQDLASRLKGFDLFGTTNATVDDAAARSLEMLSSPNDYAWQALRNYAGIIQPGAGIGGTSTSTATQGGNNMLSGALGGGLLGLDLYRQLGGSGGTTYTPSSLSQADIGAPGYLNQLDYNIGGFNYFR